MSKELGIVFIHGAGLGHFVWEDLSPFLSHPQLSIEFPNRANQKNNKGISFDDYLQSAIQQIEYWETKEFVIIAHSIGGCLGIKLSDHFGEKVKAFVGISAIIPTNGQSFTDCFPFPQRLILPLILSLFGTKPPNAALEKELCNDLNDKETRTVIEKFTPESKKLYTAKINYGSLPKKVLYVKLTNDNAIPESMQSKMIEHLNCENVVELDCGHLAMMSKPQELAGIVNEFLPTTT